MSLLLPVLLLATPGIAGESRPGSASGFTVEGTWDLPERLTHVLDVRWGGGESFLVASFLDGTFSVELAPPEGPGAVRLVRSGGGGGSPRMHWHLAGTEDLLAIGAPAHEVVLYRGDHGEAFPRQGAAFEFVHDLDLSGDRFALLGSRRNADGVPGSAIAWRIDLDDGEERPLLHSVDSRKGPWPIDSCGVFGLGALKFLPGGELVIVPGVEPDVYLFDGAGRLRRTWPTEPLGLVGECDLSPEEVLLLARDEEARWRWINRHRTVDDLVPLPGGDLGLVVRDPLGGPGVRWQLVHLERNGGHSILSLPFHSASDRAFLRADVRDGEAIVLMGQWWSRDTPVDATPRIWTGRFVPHGP